MDRFRIPPGTQMVEIYDAHEQGEIVKKWLRENGSAIVMGLVIAFGGLFGFKQWQVWQENNRQQAASEFEVLDQLLTNSQLDAAMDNFQSLQDEYADSPYTALAALKMAQARVVSNQPELAIGLLQHVVDNGRPRALAVVARERLARILLDQGRLDEALALLDAAPDHSGFESRFAEVRGDVYLAQGRDSEAVTAYQDALQQLEAGVGDRSKLVMKLQALGADVPEEESGS